MNFAARFSLPLLCLALALALAVPAARAADAAAAPVPTVSVQKDGKKVAIDVQLNIAVTQATAWDVLTDFANMARYIPNLSSSEAVAEGPNQMLVKQRGVARWGPFSWDFESVRRIVMAPMSRIDSTTLSGKISRMTSWSELSTIGDATRIDYHADAEVDFWLPPGLGTRAMRQELEEQFAAMAAEMLRRSGRR